MRFFILLSLLAACGGAGPQWAGSWKTAPSPPGSYVAMTLSGSGTAISGGGTQYREAGTPLSFTVSGSTAGVTFTYADNSTESFTFGQPDANHLTLQNPQRTLAFTRQ
jgi:hypothetical protein